MRDARSSETAAVRAHGRDAEARRIASRNHDAPVSCDDVPGWVSGLGNGAGDDGGGAVSGAVTGMITLDFLIAVLFLGANFLMLQSRLDRIERKLERLSDK